MTARESQLQQALNRLLNAVDRLTEIHEDCSQEILAAMLDVKSAANWARTIVDDNSP